MSIYPAINLPTLTIPRADKKAPPSTVAPLFDFLRGDFIFSADGKPVIATPEESYEQWAIKVSVTERNTRLAYSDKIGVELHHIPQVKSYEAAKSQIIKTITEAIKIHSETVSVKNFSLKAVGDRVEVGFDIKAKHFKDRRAEVTL